MRMLQTLLGASAIALAAGIASAGPVVYQDRAFGTPREQVEVTATTPDRGLNQQVRTPRLSSFAMADAGNELGLGTSFFAWCLDLADPVESGQEYDRWSGPGNPFGAPNTLNDLQVARVTAVINHNFATVTEAGVVGAERDLRHAAMQLALWEAAYETGASLNLASGDFSARDMTPLGLDVIGLATSYLDFVLDQVPTSYVVTFLRSDSGKHQDLVAASPIPLPAAAWLLIGGIGVLAATRRRRPDTGA